MAADERVSEKTMVGIETIKAGCPICKSDVKGDDVYLFFCKRCNVLFKREELRLDNPEQIESILKQKTIKRYEKDRGKLKMHPDLETLKEKKISEDKKKLLEGRLVRDKRLHYLASKTSNIVHANNCPYAKNIKGNNKLTFKDLDDAAKYKKCRCLA